MRQKYVVTYVIIATIYMILPVQTCITAIVKCICCCLHCSDKKKDDVKYYDVAASFPANYDVANPISRTKGQMRKYTHLLDHERAKGAGAIQAKIEEYEQHLQYLR